jgi:hypothetical protein
MFDAPRPDALRWMYESARLLSAHRVGASIGLTGPGVLGTERHYRSAGELAADASALKAAGVTGFAIYNLEGILASEQPERWLEAVLQAQPEIPAKSAWTSRERRRRRTTALAWRCYRRVLTSQARRR